MYHGRISLNSVIQLVLVNFVKWVQVGIDEYIPHCTYQVKPHSFPWFPAACAATIVHRNHFFRLHQQNKSSQSKVKFRQASNCCKRALEAAKLAYANKTKESIRLSGLLANCQYLFSAKVNLLYLIYSIARRCHVLYLTKPNCLLKTFLRALILLTRVCLYQLQF